jgi:hypothetical protein
VVFDVDGGGTFVAFGGGGDVHSPITP